MILQDQQKLLSFLGLFPFIALAALIWINPVWDIFILLIFIFYSLFIHFFLCGSWWGIAREKNKSVFKIEPLVLGMPDTPTPTSYSLTKNYYPSKKSIAKCISKMLNIKKINLNSIPIVKEHDRPKEFLGPF